MSKDNVTMDRYLRDMQSKAMDLQSVLEVKDYLENEGQLEGAQITLSRLALGLASELNSGLDSVNLPRAKA